MIVFVAGLLAFLFISLTNPLLFSDTGRQLDTHAPLSSEAYYADESSYEAYITLQRPEEIDGKVKKRALEITSYYSNHPSEVNARCDNIMIYMPDAFAFHGHGSQINTYLMTVLVATYLNRPLVLLEPDGAWNKYDGGSQFGCPDVEDVDMLPKGLSRLIDHPVWLHNGCTVPDSHDYGVYNQMSSNFNADGTIAHDNASGRDVNVIVARGSPVRGFFRQISHEMMSNSNPDLSKRWAVNLGASQEEAARFIQMENAGQKWDYVLGLMVKSGILRLQPWIARDVQRFLRDVDLVQHPDMEFDAIHVRRGDKLIKESRGPVVQYWVSKGYTEETMPQNYIPFGHYLNQWGKEECSSNGNGLLEHHVYIATDDPDVVKREIANLIAERAANSDKAIQPQHTRSPILLFNDCHLLVFYFNPTQDKSFHIGGDGEQNPLDGDNCSARYNRNIAGMADLFVLARSQTFIGEFNSNWGKLLRVMRIRLTDHDPYSVVLDTRVAWGRDSFGGPGL